MKENVIFQIGQIVYSVVNSEITGQVTGVLFREYGVMYLVVWSNDLTERYHFAVELKFEKVCQ